MKVIIENTTDVARQQLAKAAGNDPLRLSMMGVYVDFAEKCLVVTNAHVLITYPFDVKEGSEHLDSKPGVLLPLDFFNPNRWMRVVPKAKKNRIIEPEFILFDDHAEVWWLGEMIFSAKYIEEKYPNWKAVMPKESEIKTLSNINDGDLMGIDIRRVKSLVDAFPKGESSVIKMQFFGINRALLFQSINSDWSRQIKAILMPSSIESL